MKTVFSEYGSVMMAGLIAVLLILMVSRGRVWEAKTLPQVTGEFLSMDNQALLVEGGTMTFVDYCKKVKPQINVRDYRIYAGDSIPISSLFTAKDHRGKEISLAIMEASFKSGTGDKEGEVIFDNSKLRFTAPGVYEMALVATDDEYRCTRATVSIPVQHKLGGMG